MYVCMCRNCSLHTNTYYLRMHACMYIHIHTHIHLDIQGHESVVWHACIHTYIHTFTYNVYARECVISKTCVHTYVHTHTYIHTYTYNVSMFVRLENVLSAILVRDGQDWIVLCIYVCMYVCMYVCIMCMYV
jgi:hypothetical protein